MYLSLRISFSLRSVDVDANYLFYLFILNTESENLWDHGIKKINFHLGWGWTREYSLEAGPRDDVQQQSSRLNQDGSSRAASSPVQSISWIALITPRVQSDVGARTCFRWTGLQDFGTPVSRSELPHRTVSLYESWPPSFRELPTLPPSRHPFSFIREGSPLQGCKLQLIGSTLKNQDISLSLSLGILSSVLYEFLVGNGPGNLQHTGETTEATAASSEAGTGHNQCIEDPVPDQNGQNRRRTRRRMAGRRRRLRQLQLRNPDGDPEWVLLWLLTRVTRLSAAELFPQVFAVVRWY